jgi:hypothetical protein
MIASTISIHTKFTIISLLQYSDCFQRLGFCVNLHSLSVEECKSVGWPWRNWNWSGEAAWSRILQANLKLEQAHERALLLLDPWRRRLPGFHLSSDIPNKVTLQNRYDNVWWTELWQMTFRLKNFNDCGTSKCVMKVIRHYHRDC